jgi:hypothetical protein
MHLGMPIAQPLPPDELPDLLAVADEGTIGTKIDIASRTKRVMMPAIALRMSSESCLDF